MAASAASTWSIDGLLEPQAPNDVDGVRTESASGAAVSGLPALKMSFDTTPDREGFIPAATARAAGRAVAALATDDEYRALIDRHRVLAKSVVLGECSPADKRELQLLRWEIDRIQDAQESTERALLDALVAPHRELAREISGFVRELTKANIIPPPKRKPPR